MLHSIVPHIRYPRPPQLILRDFIHRVFYCNQWRTQEFCSGGGVQKIQLRTEGREQESGGCSPLVKGSGGSCNLVQEISFHIVKFS